MSRYSVHGLVYVMNYYCDNGTHVWTTTVILVLMCGRLYCDIGPHVWTTNYCKTGPHVWTTNYCKTGPHVWTTTVILVLMCGPLL